MMTDRRCIRSNGKETFPLSSMMLMSCCTNCGGSNRHVKILNAWEYARDKGLVNGSIKMNEYSPKDVSHEHYISYRKFDREPSYFLIKNINLTLIIYRRI